MYRVTIQQIWNEAWKRFWRNWIPAITLLPVPIVVGAALVGLAAWGGSAALTQISYGESWTKITAFLLVLIYLGLFIVGATIFTLGPDQIALSIARKGIYRLQGDVLPSNPIVVFLNFLVMGLLYSIIFIAAALALTIIVGVLSFIFVGEWNSLDDFYRAGALAPIFVLLNLVFLAAFYVFTWPATYLLLSGRNAISVISESLKFMRRHWEVVIAFDIGRLFVLFFSLLVTSVVGVSSLIPSVGSILLDALDFMKIGSDTSILTAFLSIMAFLFILVFLILMRAVAFTMLHEEGRESEEQEQLSSEATSAYEAPNYPYPNTGGTTPLQSPFSEREGYQG